MPDLTAPTPSKCPVNADAMGRRRPGRLLIAACVLIGTSALAAQPFARDVELKGVEDTQTRGQVAATDAAGGKLTYKLKSGPRHGEAEVDAATGAFTYTPPKDFSGDDVFAIEISNGKRSSSATVRLDVDGVNDSPTAAPLSLKTPEDTAVRGTIVAHDVDGDSVAFMISAEPKHGEASIDARTGVVSYKPAHDYNGPDAFSVEVTDGRLTATSEVSVMVASVNDAPVIAAASLELDEDSRLVGKPIASDVDGDPLTFRVAKLPKHGELEANVQTGAFTYVPAKDFHGDDAFQFEVSDGKRKATAPIALRVRAVNDAPVAKGISLSTNEDTAVSGAIVATDVDADTLAFKIGTPAAHGTAVVDARSGRVSYSPAADYNGPDAFAVIVSDGSLTAQADVVVAIAAINDAPRVAGSALSLDEDGRLEGKPTASDIDGDPLSFRVIRKPTHGAFELNAQTGAFTYQPARDYNGADGFALEVTDGKLKSEIPVSIDVRAVNDAPVAKALQLSTPEDIATKGVVLASDVDDVALTYSVKTAASHGTATVDARTGAVSYLPAADYNGVDAFTVEVKDGALSALSECSVAISAVPDIPRVRPLVLATLEDTAAEGMLPGSDPDGDRLTFRLLSQPRLGTAVLVDASTGAWTLTPGADLNGEDEVMFDVSDGTTTVKGSVKIVVTPVNDAPTLASLDLSTLEDVGVEGQLMGKDIDGDVLIYKVVAAPGRGKATVASSLVRYEPARDQNGAMAFTVTVSDGKLTSAPATVSVRIEPQNDAPVAVDSKLTTNEDTQLMGALKASDVDGDKMAFEIVRPPAHGTVNITDHTAGLFVYMPAADYFGEDDFSFSATDSSKAAGVASVRLNVLPVNDVPVAAADGLSAPFRGTVTGRLYGYDRESKTVTYKIVEQPNNGRVKLLNERTGDFEYASDGSTSLSTTFRFVVSDGELTSPPADMVVSIRAVSSR